MNNTKKSSTKKQQTEENWSKRNISIFIIFLVSILYTSRILFSPDKFIPYGIDYDSNLSPITSMLKGNLLWDDSWWLGFPNYAGSLSNIFYPISTIIFLIFGIIFGLKLLIFIHVLLSGIGFYLFSQYLTKNNTARLYGSIVYILCGSLAVKIIAGHLEKIFIFPWIPITLYFFYKYINDRKPKHIIFSSISASMFVLVGDLYGAFFFSFLFLAFFLVKIIGSKDRDLMFSFLEIGILTLLISSIKLIPLMFLKGFLFRNIDVLQGLENVLFVFSRFYSTSTETSYGVWESYSFIGILPFILFIIGALFNKSKDKYYLLLFVAISLFWVQGNDYSIAKMVHSIPVLDEFRVPTRIYMFLTFCLVALSVQGFDFISNKLRESRSKQSAIIASCLIIFVSFYSLYSENNRFLALDIDQSDWNMYEYVGSNIKSSGLSNSNTPVLVVITDPKSITSQHNFMQNGVYYFNAYYGYRFYDVDHINISSTSYSIPDIKIGYNTEKAGEQGQLQVQLTPEQYNNSLPFAFIIRNNQVIEAKIARYAPGNVIINIENALPNDIVVIKSHYYIGWSVRLGEKGDYTGADNYQNLVSYWIKEPQENLKIQFLYRPIDLYIASLVALLSIPFSLMVIFEKRCKKGCE